MNYLQSKPHITISSCMPYFSGIYFRILSIMECV